MNGILFVVVAAMVGSVSANAANGNSCEEIASLTEFTLTPNEHMENSGNNKYTAQAQNSTFAELSLDLTSAKTFVPKNLTLSFDNVQGIDTRLVRRLGGAKTMESSMYRPLSVSSDTKSFTFGKQSPVISLVLYAIAKDSTKPIGLEVKSITVCAKD